MNKILTQDEANAVVAKSLVILVNGVPFVNGNMVRGRVVADRIRKAFYTHGRYQMQR